MIRFGLLCVALAAVLVVPLLFITDDFIASIFSVSAFCAFFVGAVFLLMALLQRIAPASPPEEHEAYLKTLRLAGQRRKEPGAADSGTGSLPAGREGEVDPLAPRPRRRRRAA